MRRFELLINFDPDEFAKKYDIQVVEEIGFLANQGTHGRFEHNKCGLQLIRIDGELDKRTRQYVLTHELGHWVFKKRGEGHDALPDEEFGQRKEMDADYWASRKLLPETKFSIFRNVNLSATASEIAEHFDVLKDIVEFRLGFQWSLRQAYEDEKAIKWMNEFIRRRFAKQ